MFNLNMKVIRLQKGVNTLAVTLLLLLLSSLVVFYTARHAINEQRLSANELRAKQAFAAATAGMEHAMGYFSSSGGVDKTGGGLNGTDPDNVADTITAVGLFDVGTKPSYYAALFCSPSSEPPRCPVTHTASFSCDTALESTNLRNPLIVACGWSDDDMAVVRLVQKASKAPTLPGKITAPVVTKGVTNLLTGGASIMNYFNDLTVWSGGGVPSKSATGKTFVRDISTDSVPNPSRDFRNTGMSPGCENPPGGYVCATYGNATGHDIIDNDVNLGSLDSAAFFKKFLSTDKEPAAYREGADWTIDLTGAISADSNDINTLKNKNDSVLWVEGNVTSLPDPIGTPERPVILVINGKLDIQGSPVINGLVFVRGEVYGTGSPTIYGALIAEEATNVNGNVKVIYDPNVLKNTSQLGKAAKLQGSWRDWD